MSNLYLYTINLVLIFAHFSSRYHRDCYVVCIEMYVGVLLLRSSLTWFQLAVTSSDLLGILDCDRTSSIVVSSLKGRWTGQPVVEHETYLKPYHTLILKCIFILTPYDAASFHRSISHLSYTGPIPPLLTHRCLDFRSHGSGRNTAPQPCRSSPELLALSSVLA